MVRIEVAYEGGLRIRRIGRLPLQVRIPARLGPETRDALERAAHACPVHRSVHPDVRAPIRLESVE